MHRNEPPTNHYVSLKGYTKNPVLEKYSGLRDLWEVIKWKSSFFNVFICFFAGSSVTRWGFISFILLWGSKQDSAYQNPDFK